MDFDSSSTLLATGGWPSRGALAGPLAAACRVGVPLTPPARLSSHAPGSADATIKVWDVRRGYCTHNFRGSTGVVR